jgi:hypothetical protein
MFYEISFLEIYSLCRLNRNPKTVWHPLNHNVFSQTTTLILLDTGVRTSWTRLLAGKTGVVSLRSRGPQFAPIPSQVAGLVPRGLKAEGGWTPDEWLERGVRFHSLNGSLSAGMHLRTMDMHCLTLFVHIGRAQDGALCTVCTRCGIGSHGRCGFAKSDGRGAGECRMPSSFVHQ